MKHPQRRPRKILTFTIGKFVEQNGDDKCLYGSINIDVSGAVYRDLSNKSGKNELVRPVMVYKEKVSSLTEFGYTLTYIINGMSEKNYAKLVNNLLVVALYENLSIFDSFSILDSDAIYTSGHFAEDNSAELLPQINKIVREYVDKAIAPFKLS